MVTAARASPARPPRRAAGRHDARPTYPHPTKGTSHDRHHRPVRLVRPDVLGHGRQLDKAVLGKRTSSGWR